MFKERDHTTLVYILYAATRKFCMRMAVLFSDSAVKRLSHKREHYLSRSPDLLVHQIQSVSST
jgi:hypothetical protein